MTEINEITKENCGVLLAAYIEKESISAREVAKAITCSEITVNRIIAGKTTPSSEMIKQVGIMIEIGFKLYKKLWN